MYQALYRKYRPRTFGDVVGQEHITETLLRQLVNDRCSHAYLFVGTRGTGKTTCAKILSRAVNCLSPIEGEPCNACTACIGIEDGSILDVLELDAASNNSVDNVRALRDEAIYSPASVNKRVYIVDEVHMLSISAFNALLKILEEPPEHILFILATTELHKVPATIQGRCQRFSFKRLLPSVLEERLNSIASREGLSLTADAVQRLAALADGSMRDAISLLDQCAYDGIVDMARIQDILGLAGQQEILHLVSHIASRDVISALTVIDELYMDGRDMVSLLNETTSLIRDLLVFKLSPDSSLLHTTDFSHKELAELSEKMAPGFLFSCLDILKSAISGTNRSGSSKLAVEMCIIKMCDESIESQKPTQATTPKEAAKPSVQQPHAQPPRPVQSPPTTPTSEQPPVLQDTSTQDTPQETSMQPVSPPQDTTPPPVSSANDFWADILGSLQDEPSLRALLSDSSKIQPSLNENNLNINATDQFTANLIEAEFMGLLKDNATKVLGRNVTVSIEVLEPAQGSETKEDKFERLSAFGVVNID